MSPRWLIFSRDYDCRDFATNILFSVGSCAEDVILHRDLLSPLRPVRRRQLDLLPCQSWGEPSQFWGPCISGWNSPHTVFNLVPTMKGDSWTNDAAHHHLPRAHQHLQHHPDKFAAGSRVWRKSVSLQLVPGWGPDSNGGLGDRLHRLCLRRSHGVRCPFLLSLNEYLVNLGPYLCNFWNLRLSLIRYTAILFKMKLRKLYGAKRKKDNYAMTDLTFLVVFPILFLAFNVLYWTGVYWTRTF